MIPLGYRINRPVDEKPIGFRVPQSRTLRPLELLKDDGEAHLLTVAPTGAGKGRSNIIPACLEYSGSLIVLDPKGEAARVTATSRERFGDVFIIDPFKIVTPRPHRFNPFDIVPARASPEQYGIVVAQALQGENGTIAGDPFWDNKANELLSALCIDELEKAKSFRNLRKRLYGEDVDYNLAVMLDAKEKVNSLVYDLLAAYLQVPSDKTRPCVLCTAQQHLSILGEPAVLDSLDGPTSFNVQALRSGLPMTIYLVIPPNKIKAFSSLLRLWIVSLLYLLTERKNRPEIPTLMLIDEAGNLGRMDALVSSVTLLRSYGIRIWTFWQDLGFMKRLYPQDWTTLLNNCDVVQAFGMRNFLMAKEIAEVFGTFSPQQLMQLPAGEALLARAGKKVERMKRFDYLTDKRFRKYGFEENAMYKSDR